MSQQNYLYQQVSKFAICAAGFGHHHHETTKLAVGRTPVPARSL